jgi:hypothetical protein
MTDTNILLGFDVSSDIRREFTIDKEGNITASQRGVARLLDIDMMNVVQSSLNATLAQRLTQLGIDPAEFAAKGVTDIAFTVIAEYYAYESKASNPQAKAVARCLMGVGSRKLFESIVGLESTESKALPAATDLERISHLSTCSSTRKDAPQDLVNLPDWETVREMLNRAGECDDDPNSLLQDSGFRFWINRHIADIYRAQYGEEPPTVAHKKTKAYRYPPDYQSLVNLYRKNWILQAA